MLTYLLHEQTPSWEANRFSATLIKYHLKNKHHRVTFNNKCFNFYSSWGVMKYGVPQVSMLGPLLFGSTWMTCQKL